MLCGLAAGIAVACSAGGDKQEAASGSSQGAGANGSGGGFGIGGGPGSGTGGSCAAVTETADNKVQPADIILAIDQSGSMDEETSWVTSQLNTFAQQITSSGIDVHVVVIAGLPGSENGFCIPAPLGSGNCPADNKPPTFQHVDQHVDSHDALQQILTHYPDYAAMMRPDAATHVIVITDDDAEGISAQEFDTQFKALASPMFDDYVFHGIVADDDDPGGFQCVINPQPCCGVAAAEGKVYKDLIAMKQGVYGDLCQQAFQPVWDAVSTQVITNAALACEWDIPPPPDGQSFDPTKVNVEYTVNGGSPQQLGQVGSAAECANVADGWYYDDSQNPTKILVCPQTCDLLQGADMAAVTLAFGCATVLATPE